MKYTYKEISKKIEKLVENECKKPANIFGRGFWTHHIVPMAKYSLELAKRSKADKQIVELAALLHDIGVIKGDRETHHISGAKEAEKILKRFDYPKEKIEAIKHCILAHRASKSIERKTIEAKCIASADAISHYEEIPQLFESAFTRFKMNPQEATHWIVGKLDRDWKKLTPKAKEIINEKRKAVKLIFKNQ